MALLSLNLFSSDGNRDKTSNLSRDRVLLHYSKKTSLPKCPRLDLWVFEDGRALYKEVYEMKLDKKITSMFTQEDIQDLTQLLECPVLHHTNPKKKEGPTVTTLKYNGKEIEYYTSNMDNDLRALDNKINQLLENHIPPIYCLNNVLIENVRLFSIMGRTLLNK